MGTPKNHFNEQKMPNKPKEEPKTTVVLPYTRHLLEGIRHILSRLNIRTCFKPLRTLRNVLVHPKDRVQMLRQKGVVYRIQCQDCGSSYIGQTGRTLEHRVKEHKLAYTHAESLNSAVAEHSLDFMHAHSIVPSHYAVIDWDGAEVIALCDRSQHQLCLMESWNIRRLNSTMNLETQVCSLTFIIVSFLSRYFWPQA